MLLVSDTCLDVVIQQEALEQAELEQAIALSLAMEERHDAGQDSERTRSQHGGALERMRHSKSQHMATSLQAWQWLCVKSYACTALAFTIVLETACFLNCTQPHFLSVVFT